MKHLKTEVSIQKLVALNNFFKECNFDINILSVTECVDLIKTMDNKIDKLLKERKNN